VEWLLSAWLPVWRLHRWVYSLWLLGAVALLVATVGAATSGFNPLTFSAGLFWAIVFQGVHQWIVG
jgi:hypothetical protein